MVAEKQDQLVLHIEELDCQIEYLQRAIKLDIVNKNEEYRLNSLIVKKAHFKKELERLSTEKKACSFLSKIKPFSRQPKLISDYFSQ